MEPMKRIAVLLTHAPHGTANGREGLDALLAVSLLHEAPGLFFIGDGVLHLLADQQPALINGRDYIATFGLLPLYEITACYVCAQSLAERGLDVQDLSVLPVDALSPSALRARLAQYERVITF